MLDISLDLHAPIVLIPSSDAIVANCPLLKVNLGRARVSSQLHEAPHDLSSLSITELSTLAYDKYQVLLDDASVAFTTYGSHDSIQHPLEAILQPVSINALLQRCILSTSLDLPQLQVSAKLPKLHVVLSDSVALRLVTFGLELSKASEHALAPLVAFSLFLSRSLELIPSLRVIFR